MGLPLHKRLVFVGHRSQRDLTLNARDSVRRLSGQDFVSQSSAELAHFLKPKLPLGAILEGHLDKRIDLSWGSLNELSGLHFVWSYFFTLKGLEDFPSFQDRDV